MRCYVQELISDLNQESLLPRHIHFIRQHIIPEVLACFFHCSSTCSNTLIFDCLFRLRYDWPWENQERIPLVYKCFWWRQAHGFELPENQANQYIFQAAMRKIFKKECLIPDFSRRALLNFNDIAKVLLRLRNACWGYYLFMSGVTFFLESTGGFAARRNRGSIHILERDGFADPNSHPWNMFQLWILG
jgi:hypothetical protein